MQVFSWLSYCCTLAGLLFLGLEWVIYADVKPLVLAGCAALLLGAVFSLAAFLRKEKSGLKYISFSVIVVLLVSAMWLEPPAITTLSTWLEDLA